MLGKIIEYVMTHPAAKQAIEAIAEAVVKKYLGNTSITTPENK